MSVCGECVWRGEGVEGRIGGFSETMVWECEGKIEEWWTQRYFRKAQTSLSMTMTLMG